MNKYPSDEEILRQVRNEIGGEQLAKELFLKYRSSFEGFMIHKKGIAPGLATELYINAFEIFYRKAKADEITTPLKSNLNTYLIGIGKNLLLQLITHDKKHKTESLDEILEKYYFDIVIEDEVDVYQKEEHKLLAEQILNSANDKCREIFILTFLKEYSDDAIMREMGYDNEGAVRQQRMRCIEKCRKILQTDKPNIKN